MDDDAYINDPEFNRYHYQPSVAGVTQMKRRSNNEREYDRRRMHIPAMIPPRRRSPIGSNYQDPDPRWHSPYAPNYTEETSSHIYHRDVGRPTRKSNYDDNNQHRYKNREHDYYDNWPQDRPRSPTPHWFLNSGNDGELSEAPKKTAQFRHREPTPPRRTTPMRNRGSRRGEAVDRSRSPYRPKSPERSPYRHAPKSPERSRHAPKSPEIVYQKIRVHKGGRSEESYFNHIRNEQAQNFAGRNDYEPMKRSHAYDERNSAPIKKRYDLNSHRYDEIPEEHEQYPESITPIRSRMRSRGSKYTDRRQSPSPTTTRRERRGRGTSPTTAGFSSSDWIDERNKLSGTVSKQRWGSKKQETSAERQQQASFSTWKKHNHKGMNGKFI